MKKILCYIYEGMADFEISLLLHRLRNTGKMEIVAISESRQVLTAQSGLHYIADKPNELNVRCHKDCNVITAKGYAFVDFALAVCDALHIFETNQQRYEQLERVKEKENILQ